MFKSITCASPHSFLKTLGFFTKLPRFPGAFSGLMVALAVFVRHPQGGVGVDFPSQHQRYWERLPDAIVMAAAVCFDH